MNFNYVINHTLDGYKNKNVWAPEQLKILSFSKKSQATQALSVSTFKTSVFTACVCTNRFRVDFAPLYPVHTGARRENPEFGGAVCWQAGPQRLLPRYSISLLVGRGPWLKVPTLVPLTLWIVLGILSEHIPVFVQHLTQTGPPSRFIYQMINNVIIL